MGGINVQRWLLGGVVAGVVIWLLEGLGAMLYMDDMTEAMEAAGLSMEMSAVTWVFTVVVSLIVGLVAIFFYAAARPRFGPGPRTAILVAVVFFCGGYLVSLVGYHMIGLFPDRLLASWGIVGLVEIVAATLVGGWVYRES